MFPKLLRALPALAVLLALSACSEAKNPLVPQVRPVDGGWISSPFGPREVHPIKGYIPGGHHDGYDFAVAKGSPIHAAMGGTVSYAGWMGGYGNTVMLKHPDGWTTLYGHASALKVKLGQEVQAGQMIALVGSTGLSTGPHLHYELRHYGTPVDPVAFTDAPELHSASISGPLPHTLTLRQARAHKLKAKPGKHKVHGAKHA